MKTRVAAGRIAPRPQIACGGTKRMEERLSVLVVDDDREIVQAIALLLEKEGYRVLRAYDGMEALEQAMDRSVRLMIIDVMMPRLDGLSAVMKLRERRNLPIIVLSAKSEDTDKVLGLSMGADAVSYTHLTLPTT